MIIWSGNSGSGDGYPYEATASAHLYSIIDCGAWVLVLLEQCFSHWWCEKWDFSRHYSGLVLLFNSIMMTYIMLMKCRTFIFPVMVFSMCFPSVMATSCSHSKIVWVFNSTWFGWVFMDFYKSFVSCIYVYDMYMLRKYLCLASNNYYHAIHHLEQTNITLYL